ncbi:MAG: hypothetical protein IKB87_03045 [Clostridia bacterium]|nr:hypothetical protein [Clostridia bacterium]
MRTQRLLFPLLYGNDHFRTVVGSDILLNRFGHAYIIEGPEGSGKHTAAEAVSAALSCENKSDSAFPLPCGRCLSCRKITGRISPDVQYIRRDEDRATMGVSTIRRLREDLWIAPNENEKKVYIIENAETMTEEAQNALLLSLEDPPPYVVFILLTKNATALLETIRSRAPVFRMQTFSVDEIAAFLKSKPFYKSLADREPKKFSEAVIAGEGAVGKAESLLSADDPVCAETFALRENARLIVSQLFFPSSETVIGLLKTIPKERGDAAELLRLAATALRDLAAVKKSAAVPPLFYGTADECRAVTDKVSLERIVLASDDVMAARGDILANGTIQPIFVSLFMNKH